MKNSKLLMVISLYVISLVGVAQQKENDQTSEVKRMI